MHFRVRHGVFATAYYVKIKSIYVCTKTFLNIFRLFWWLSHYRCYNLACVMFCNCGLKATSNQHSACKL